MEYKIVKEEYDDTFQKEVNNLIKNGWKPQGGVGIFYDLHKDKIIHYQAMIK